MPELTTNPSIHIQIYQFHVLLLQINPAIWRRFLVRSDSSIANLHYTLQIIMGWEDLHLHRFVRPGKEYGIAKPGGAWFGDDPAQILISDLHLRLKERFIYEYDFRDFRQHQLRLEQVLPLDPTTSPTHSAWLVVGKPLLKVVADPGTTWSAANMLPGDWLGG